MQPIGNSGMRKMHRKPKTFSFARQLPVRATLKRTELAYMPYAPIVYVSAKTGQRVETLFERINYVYNQSTMRISTGMLNEVLAEATMRVQPPTDKGRRLKIYYMTQISVAPPTFVIFCNNAELFHFSYQRYIENCLRDTFGFSGTPIRIIIRMKGDESV